MSGLSSQEAENLLQKWGFNELHALQKRPGVQALLSLWREPMILLLFACAGIYFFLGDQSEAWVLLASVLLISGITVYQEYKTERTLDLLRKLSSPRAEVLRDGKWVRIPGREVVPGDWLSLHAGDRVPADALLKEAQNLMIDESMLTGESVPVVKQESETPLYSGTLIVRGQGKARVQHTGPRTRMGEIGTSMSQLSSGKTLLQEKIQTLTLRLAIAGSAFCLLIVAFYGFHKGHWLEGILAGLTLAISLMPEELPLVLTLFFAMGAWRMARHRVLTRKLSAIETLGTIDTLATDKTGTLTLNEMKLERYEASPLLMEKALLACPPGSSDPMDRAIDKAFNAQVAAAAWEPVKEYPLESQFLAVTLVWRDPSNQSGVCALKGAPEHVLTVCDFGSPQERSHWQEEAAAWGKDGYRVLAVAHKTLPSLAELPTDPRQWTYSFCGLLGFIDPLRPNVSHTLQSCREAGIRVVMMTGDSPETAQAIARQAGWTHLNVLTGEELQKLSPEEKERTLLQTALLARISPEQKLEVVQVLQKQGHIVGMTGDGINDGPSLKAANIGVAMGQRGTDIAREAADLVILDDQFSTLVNAIHRGRAIYENIRKAAAFIVAVHIPIACLALFQTFFFSELLLHPIHVVFLELIIDPACTLVFEAQHAPHNLMKRPPRSAHEPLMNSHAIVTQVYLGLLITVFSILAFQIGSHSHASPEQIRTLTFSTLILGNLGLIFAEIVSEHRHVGWRIGNSMYLPLLLGASLTLLICHIVPPLRRLFLFETLPPNLHAAWILLGLFASVAVILVSRFRARHEIRVIFSSN